MGENMKFKIFKLNIHYGYNEITVVVLGRSCRECQAQEPMGPRTVWGRLMKNGGAEGTCPTGEVLELVLGCEGEAPVLCGIPGGGPEP